MLRKIGDELGHTKRIDILTQVTRAKFERVLLILGTQKPIKTRVLIDGWVQSIIFYLCGLIWHTEDKGNMIIVDQLEGPLRKYGL